MRGTTTRSERRGRQIRWRSFLRDRRGATMVEFGLISVPFLGLLFAIFQNCLSFLMQQGLQVAVEQAARQVLVGTAQNNGSVASWQQFRDTYLCPSTGSLLPSFVPCASVLVDVRPYSNFSGLAAGNVNASFLSDGPQYNPGTSCQIVVVRAAYPMPIFLPTLATTGLGGNVTVNRTGETLYSGRWVQMLTAAAVFRNEPYAPGGC